MNFVVKTFDELTKIELYEILRARSQIFIVEQKMNCQDLDQIDFDALHFYLCEDGKIFAYLRAFYVEENIIRIGRVLTVEHGKGFGKELVVKTIEYLKEKVQFKTLCLDSQKYAVGFYEKLGFKTVSDEFLEEGVLHVKMERQA